MRPWWAEMSARYSSDDGSPVNARGASCEIVDTGIWDSALVAPFPASGMIDDAPAITADCRFGASDGPAVALA